MGYDRLPLRWFFPPQRDASALRRGARHLAGLLAVIGHHLLRLWPIDAASFIGQALWAPVGRARFPGASRKMADNWSRLRPQDAAPERIEAVVSGQWRNLGRIVSEYSLLDRLWAAGRLSVSGGEQLAAAVKASRPVIVMGLHLGNWEVIPLAIIGLGHGLSGIYQQPADPLDHWLLVRARRRYGLSELAPQPGSARKALRVLEQRSGALIIFADEWVDGYVNAPAFGRAMSERGNIANIARLAAKTGALVIPAYALRTGGPSFKVHFLPPVDLRRDGDVDATLADNIHRLNATIEPIVRAHLDQWLMLSELRLDG